MRHQPVQMLEVRLFLSRPPLSSAVEAPLAAPGDFVTTADFNRDGKMDVALSSYAGRSVSFLAGTGGNGLAPPVTIPISFAPDFVTAADLNSDASPDLVAVSFDSNLVVTLLGNGSGGFAVRTSPAGTGSRAAVVGDFDHDGIPDLALARSYEKALTILRGKGDGTFAAPVDAQLHFVPNDLVAGDFNRDGKLDLAAAAFFSDRIYLLPGRGDGTFDTSSPASMPTRGGPTSITAADLNADNKLDLITANLDDDNVSVFLGHGDGTFDAAVNIAAGDGPTHVSAADLDNDRHLDLVVVDSLGDQLTILLGRGDGSFDSPVTRNTGRDPRAAAIAELNSDGTPDVVVANQAASSLSTYWSDGSSPSASLDSAPPVTSSGSSTYTFQVIYHDDVVIDGSSFDGQDIVVTGPDGSHTPATFVDSSSPTSTEQVATYRIEAPNDFFTPECNGQYTIELRGGQVADTAGNPAPAKQLGTFTVNATDAGNTRQNARSLGKLVAGRARKATDYVGSSDANDWFSFSATKLTRAVGRISGLADNADAQLFNSAGKRLMNLKHSGAAAESFDMDLTKGTYYLRVLYPKGSAGTGYALRIEPGAPLPKPSDDNSIGTAANLGTLTPGKKTLSASGAVGTNDRDDYFKFTLTKTANVTTQLSGLTDNADLQLLSTTGGSLLKSAHPGAASESIVQTLSAGTYILRVTFRGGTRGTYFRINVSAR